MLVNWRRGLLRLWLLISFSWIVSWALYMTISNANDGFRLHELLAIPVLLCKPPCAVLILGFTTKWAMKGFKPAPLAELQRLKR